MVRRATSLGWPAVAQTNTMRFRARGYEPQRHGLPAAPRILGAVESALALGIARPS